MNKFKRDLQNYDWSSLDKIEDINKMYASFINSIHNLYEKSFPIKTILIKSHERLKPWITGAIKTYIYKKTLIVQKIPKN